MPRLRHCPVHHVQNGFLLRVMFWDSAFLASCYSKSHIALARLPSKHNPSDASRDMFLIFRSPFIQLPTLSSLLSRKQLSNLEPASRNDASHQQVESTRMLLMASTNSTSYFIPGVYFLQDSYKYFSHIDGGMGVKTLNRHVPTTECSECLQSGVGSLQQLSQRKS